MIDLVIFPGCISILKAGSGIYWIYWISLTHKHFPTLHHSPSVLQVSLFSRSFTNILLAVCLPAQHSVFSHVLSACLFLILSLISILLSMSWRQIGRSQPGSCVLLVLCHRRDTLENPLSICLEELKDALCPGTSGLRVARRGPYRKLHLVHTQLGSR